jgi:hypothetical protein
MRKLLPLLMIACLAGAVVAVPAASAKPAHSAASSNGSKQLKKSIKKTNKSIKKLAAALAVLTGSNKSNADSIKTIVDGVPAIVNGLTALKDGLTTLGAAYQSVEYGVYHAVISTSGAGPVPPGASDTPNGFSPDIPDDGNGAQSSAAFPVPIPSCGAPCGGAEIPAGTATVNARASIRSAEADGKAGGDPAGQVAGVYYVTCGTAGGCGSTAAGQSSVPTGAILCSAITPANNYSYTNPASGQTSLQQLVNIPLSTSRTDQSRPSDDPTDGLTVNATAGNTCSFGAVTGRTYLLQMTMQFFDLPTSTSPGATD